MASGSGRGALRRAGGLLGCVLLQAALATPASAEEQPPPLDLLAYLGSWPETDAEWVAVAQWAGRIETEAPDEPEPREENDDE